MLHTPEMYITVHDHLVAFRGKCPFRLLHASKPTKHDTKHWVLCDNTISYAWNIYLYLGKQHGSTPEWNQDLRVVIVLVQDLKGYYVTCDNFFTSYDLRKILIKNKYQINNSCAVACKRDSKVHIDICIHKGYNSCIVLP